MWVSTAECHVVYGRQPLISFSESTHEYNLGTMLFEIVLLILKCFFSRYREYLKDWFCYIGGVLPRNHNTKTTLHIRKGKL